MLGWTFGGHKTTCPPSADPTVVLAHSSYARYLSAVTSVRAAIESLRFSIVGPGRVGSSLAHWLVARGARLTLVGSRRAGPGKTLADRLGGDRVQISDLQSDNDDLLLVTVGDEALADVATVLAARPQAAVVLHASGCVGVEVLAPLRTAGTEIGGLHPLRAFPEASTDVDEASRLVFALGGDRRARQLAGRLVDSWNGTRLRVEDDQRALYHLAASMAAGGVVTLLATAEALAEKAGLPAAVVRGYHALAHQALEQAERQGRSAAAITGPVARGDLETIERQLVDLVTTAPDTIDIVVAVATETLRLRALDGTAPPKQEQIHSILAKALERKSFLDRD